MIIGICGGSASGKTTLASKLKSINPDLATVVAMDSFYFDKSELSIEDCFCHNFDHPTAFDTELLVGKLKQLMSGVPVRMPQYSYTTHARTVSQELIYPCPIIIVEGLYLLLFQTIRELIDYRVFLEVPETIRYNRIIERDSIERNDGIDATRKIYLRDIKPMHELYIEPQKGYADLILDYSTEIWWAEKISGLSVYREATK